MEADQMSSTCQGPPSTCQIQSFARRLATSALLVGPIAAGVHVLVHMLTNNPFTLAGSCTCHMLVHEPQQHHNPINKAQSHCKHC